ncbi:MAG: hypothetical protein ABJG78_15635 [Cyclobacteriaceae bacterium]
MKKLLFHFFITISLYTHSQDGKFNFGARNMGLAGATVTLGDSYSLFNNVGGLGKVERHHVFGGYQSRYEIRELQIIGAGAIYHTKHGNAGVGFYKFGDNLFSQQRIHIAVGNQIQMVSLGVSVDLIQYNVSSVGTKQAISIEFGGIAEITPKLFFGAHIFNLNQADLSKETGEKIPTVMKSGISYRPSSELLLNLEIEKDLGFDEMIKVGLEYQLITNVFIRTGINTKPFLSAFGAGFHPKKFRFDYAYANDSNLGSVHEISLGYSFQE